MGSVTGKLGDAYEMDALSGFTLLTEDSTRFAFDPTSEGGTMFFWFKGTNTNYEPFFEVRMDWTGMAFIIDVAWDGSMSATVLGGDYLSTTASFPGPLDITTWHFVCATFDNASGDVNLYIDDMDVITQAGTGQVLFDAAPSAVFKITQSSIDNTVSLTIDEIGIAATAEYSADQVVALYNKDLDPESPTYGQGLGVTWPAVNSI